MSSVARCFFVVLATSLAAACGASSSSKDAAGGAGGEAASSGGAAGASQAGGASAGGDAGAGGLGGAGGEAAGGATAGGATAGGAGGEGGSSGAAGQVASGGSAGEGGAAAAAGAGGGAAPSCDDGVKNGDETDVDCGGGCGPCGVGKSCGAAGDCKSRECEGSLCVATQGCSDLTRDDLFDKKTYPDIAACEGGWSVPGVSTPESMEPACDRASGRDGQNVKGDGCSVADLCQEGWHVCSDHTDVAAHKPNGPCMIEEFPAKMKLQFYLTRQGGGPDNTCVASGNEEIYGCGIMGLSDVNECGPLNRRSGLNCNSLAGSFSCPKGKNEGATVTKSGPDRGGVLCCRDLRGAGGGLCCAPMATVSLAVSDAVAVITLDDGKANAQNPTLLGELEASLDEVEGRGLAAVIAGRKGVYSGGLDLKVLPRLDEPGLRAAVTQFTRVMLRIFTFARPVVAACTGHAIAGGSVLALAADERVMARGDFRVGLNETALGVGFPRYVVEMAQVQLSPRWQHRVLVAGDLFSPEQALDIGLVDQLADEGEVIERATQRARSLAALPAAAYAFNKQLVRGAAAARGASSSEGDFEAFMRALRAVAR